MGTDSVKQVFDAFKREFGEIEACATSRSTGAQRQTDGYYPTPALIELNAREYQTLQASPLPAGQNGRALLLLLKKYRRHGESND